MTGASRIFVLLDKLRRAQLWLAAAALVVMMCVTVVDVFMRYVFNRPVRGGYDLVETMLVIFVFHGISTSFLYRRNIVIDLVDSFASPHLVRMLIRLSDVLSIVAIVFFAFAMVGPAMQAFSYGDVKLELQLPIYIFWIVALAGMAGAILCAFGALLTPAAPRHDGPPT